MVLTLYFWKSVFLQSWICIAGRYFSISDTVPTCDFPLVWKAENKTQTQNRLYCRTRDYFFIFCLALVIMSKNNTFRSELKCLAQVLHFNPLRKLCDLKGIRGNALICFEKWVREQCPNQLTSFVTKYIQTNHRPHYWHQSRTHTRRTSRQTAHLPYCASKRATLISLHLQKSNTETKCDCVVWQQPGRRH